MTIGAGGDGATAGVVGEGEPGVVGDATVEPGGCVGGRDVVSPEEQAARTTASTVVVMIGWASRFVLIGRTVLTGRRLSRFPGSECGIAGRRELACR
jgi:hypothetical protein